MKYLRKFNTEADYNAFKESDNYVTPNVVLVNGNVDYNPPPPLPLYIEALENLTVTFSNTYEYSKDNKTWTAGTSSTSISANAGERVFFRTYVITPSSSNGIGSFAISNGKCNVGGNVMSMATKGNYNELTKISRANQFKRLFENNVNIIDASKLLLPATTLKDSCYSRMFQGCTSLVNAPSTLSATTLASDCCYSMFNNCTSLVNAPALPATTLESFCYDYMFYGCTSLVNAPMLPAATLAAACYRNMFFGCTSLVNAPMLPAATLENSCYYGMFQNCTSLNYIKAMFTTSPSTDYMESWVSGVASSGTFVKNSAATWTDTFGVSAIPEGWTVETANA